MPKQLSALNTLWIIHYLHEFHPSVDTEAMLARINEKSPFYIENLNTGNVEMVSVQHLVNPNYWLSNKFMMAFYHEIKTQINIPHLGYKIGRMAHQSQPISKAAIFAPLIGPQQLLKRLVRESNKFNRTKKSVLLKNTEGHAVIRLIHHDGILMDDFGMDWHGGVFHAYAELSGTKITSIEWHKQDPAYKVVDFDIRYENPGLVRRLFAKAIFSIPIVRKTLAKAEAIQHEHRITILNQEKIIEERTEKLKSAQDQLIEQERRMTEAHIAGGMAHEIRNALGAAKLWTRQARQNEEDASSVDHLMLILKALKGANGVAESEYKNAVQAFRALHEKHKATRQGIHEIDQALDRSLKITYRVLAYAGMEGAKERERVDLQSLAEEFSRLYSGAKDAGGIRIELDFKEKLYAHGSESQLRSVLHNLLLNACDAINEAGIENGWIRICASKDESAIKLAIEDNGPGIPEEDQQNIFKPFFTTKPSTGMGLGLNECQKMVNAMGGRIEFESRLERGAIFRLFIPVQD